MIYNLITSSTIRCSLKTKVWSNTLTFAKNTIWSLLQYNLCTIRLYKNITLTSKTAFTCCTSLTLINCDRLT